MSLSPSEAAEIRVLVETLRRASFQSGKSLTRSTFPQCASEEAEASARLDAYLADLVAGDAS